MKEIKSYDQKKELNRRKGENMNKEIKFRSRNLARDLGKSTLVRKSDINVI